MSGVEFDQVYLSFFFTHLPLRYYFEKMLLLTSQITLDGKAELMKLKGRFIHQKESFQIAKKLLKSVKQARTLKIQ